MSEPAGSRPLKSEEELSVGMRVIAIRSIAWEIGEVVSLRPGNEVNIHFLKFPTAFDRIVPDADIRIPLAVKEIDVDLITTLDYELIPSSIKSDVDSSAVEQELAKSVGYVLESFQIDHQNRRISLKIIRGSPAEREARFALMKSKLFVGRPLNR